ncbi:peptide deformylase [Antrihabitans cavernicola]|uniref:Peptide deformylase n=1 Tax=Antrihabitans cavernicola TaxID=2495913 RepID=A0A5A7S884_9NOCA|nr:peptide deformylase [Spelaeibacter cavernicola]KAA0022136.1 peptide deformylase [Spelaeibacter cavernicola]
MAILPIRIFGDPVLHTPTEPVTQTPAELAELIADMHETLDKANGVGLAANQIGVGLRLFVYDCPDERGDGTRHRRRGAVINPVLETSAIPETMPDPDGDDDEGCLSVPGEQYPTGRADWARVTGTDENGEPVDIEGNGFFARMLQHEVGHLDGFVYVDVLIGRNARAAKKAIKRAGWGVPGLSWTPGTIDDPFGHDD